MFFFCSYLPRNSNPLKRKQLFRWKWKSSFIHFVVRKNIFPWNENLIDFGQKKNHHLKLHSINIKQYINNVYLTYSTVIVCDVVHNFIIVASKFCGKTVKSKSFRIHFDCPKNIFLYMKIYVFPSECSTNNCLFYFSVLQFCFLWPEPSVAGVLLPQDKGGHVSWLFI